MSDLDTILKNTLKGVTEKFDTARHDLHEQVAKLAKAVQSVTDGMASVELVPSTNPATNNEKAILYHLSFFSPGQGERRALKNLRISMDGYPISVTTQDPPEVANIQNRQQLEEMMQKMVSGKDSSLVAMIAFVLRNKAISTVESIPA
ncbi:MAG TPA: hypothetical protein VN641_18795 [Urbifossiella sp.]|nr:hypothetical protein [Urbifossiella sp.]